MLSKDNAAGGQTMNRTLSLKEVIAIGFMLFALFFGAGNMIFPPALGQAAGENLWSAIAGFIATGVGLPILAVSAIARSGSDLQSLASRAHPLFGVIFTATTYLAIGPFFGIPRTGTVSFEIGITPFLPETVDRSTVMVIYTITYFALTLWLALNPSKLVDRIGKLLTPLLLIGLVLFFIKSIWTPMGTFQAPTKAYADAPFFKGFIDGYLTMDAIAALVFGIIVVNAIKERGVSNHKTVAKLCIQSGMVAAIGLIFVYLSLAFIGASSVKAIGYKQNGGEIISEAATYLFGQAGTVILSIVIMLACLTTSVGLLSSCASYFSKISPKSNYKTFVISISIFSTMIANVGLTQLIKLSVPVLIIIYPLSIVLVALSFLHDHFHGRQEVYIGALISTFMISIVDGFNAAGIDVTFILRIYKAVLPLFEQGVGWFIPAIIGGLIGFAIAQLRTKPTPQQQRKIG
jgi:LIVCS family branched-chain amino acid:cation transporter